MTYDIFLSYAYQDRESALALANRLKSTGKTICLEPRFNGNSRPWGPETAERILDSGAFLLLESEDSVQSLDILQELSFASRRKKPIVSMKLLVTSLPIPFARTLARSKRVDYPNVEGVLEAITHAMLNPERQSPLLVLPFKNLSTDRENEWFADGLSVEIASSLAQIKAIKVIDHVRAISFRGHTDSSVVLATELDVDFLVEGSVAKNGEELHIEIILRDAWTGKESWRISQSGHLVAFLDLQERVAEQVAAKLALQLTNSEKMLLRMQRTNNVEAFELVIKGHDQFDKKTQQGLLRAIDLYRDAVQMDSTYGHAIQGLAYALINYYRIYERDERYLGEAEEMVRRALEIDPHAAQTRQSLTMTLRLQGKIDEAEREAIESVRLAPESGVSHFELGLHYALTDQPAKSIEPYLIARDLRPTELDIHWNLSLVYQRINDQERCAEAASVALDQFAKWLRINPEDELRLVQQACLMFLVGDKDGSFAIVRQLESRETMDSVTLYNLACLCVNLAEHDSAIRYLRRSIEAGFSNLQILESDPDLAPLRGMQEFSDIVTHARNSINEKVHR